jgi:uncharacterized protein with von Willebrand factor type A (vWA) domain
MVFFRYSSWDGSQEPFKPGADDLMNALSDNLFEHGDMMQSLRDLFRNGMDGTDGERMQGLRDMIQRLKKERQERLESYNLDSVIDDIKEKLQEIIDLERAGVQCNLQEAKDRWEYAIPSEREEMQGPLDFVQQRADRSTQTLDSLPDSSAGAIKELSEYDFIDSEAREKFNALLDQLREQMVQNFAQRQSEAVQGMTPEQQQEMREMMHALNQMLRGKAEGKEPDFDGFMEKFGHFFDPDRPGTMDELLDMMEEQIRQLQSMLGSMSEEARSDLMGAMREALDEETISEMAELAGMMEELRPGSTQGQRYPFSGHDQMSMSEAMEMMEQLQQLDELESDLQSAGRSGDLDGIDPDELTRLLGEDARDALDEMQDVARMLEEEGYIKRDGDRWELTPRAIRKMGERALREVFGKLQKDGIGGHRIESTGDGGDPTGASAPYEPGQPFDVNLYKSLANAVKRGGAGVPIRMQVEDFEVDELEHSTDAATVLMLDQSSSMHHYGRWGAAKRVAMALQSLIQTKYPRDRLFIVGFSDYAVELKPGELPTTTPNNWMQGTNMQHAMMIARKLLARERGATRQIIMVTDGEPTAHLESGISYFDYPPSRRTVSETLKEVRNCTRAGITINIFMLEQTSYLTAFIDYVTKVNRGRAFFTDPERLGDYLLVDYLSNRNRRVA